MDARGTYHDGKTAAPHRVTLRIEPPLLRLIGEDGRTLAEWPLAAVRHVDRPVPGQVTRLRCGFDADDRLTLPMDVDPAFLRPWCPDLEKGDPAWKRAWRPILIWGSGAVATVAFLIFVAIPFLADRLADRLPQAWEEKLGAEIADQLTRVFALAERKPATQMACTDPQGQAALDAMARRLSAGADLPFPLRLRVLDSRHLNAMALPGGNILVLRGLIDFTDTLDELAGVVAHEIGHVAHRDPIRMVVERGSTTALFGLLFGDILGGMALAQVGDALINASYSRDKERAADAYGIDRMRAAGYDTNALAAFLRRLKDRNGSTDAQSGVLGYFASHPSFAERLQSVGKPDASATAAAKDSGWTAIKEMCAKRD